MATMFDFKIYFELTELEGPSPSSPLPPHPHPHHQNAHIIRFHPFQTHYQLLILPIKIRWHSVSTQCIRSKLSRCTSNHYLRLHNFFPA